MKKLTIYSLIFAVICFILASLAGMSAGEESFKQLAENAIGKKISQYKPQKYEIESTTADKTMDQFTDLNINTSSARVVIKKSTDNKLYVEYSQAHGKALTTQFSDHNINFKLDEYFEGEEDKIVIKFFGQSNFININNFGDFEFVFYIPQNIKNIKIRSQSGDLKVDNIKLDNLEIEGVSGNVRLTQVDVESVKVDLISGDIKGLGHLKNTKIKTISGNVKFEIANADPNLKIETTSGDIKLGFKSVPDALLDFSTTSGALRLDVDRGLITRKKDDDEKSVKIGNGKGSMQLKTVSGDVKIKQTHLEDEN